MANKLPIDVAAVHVKMCYTICLDLQNALRNVFVQLHKYSSFECPNNLLSLDTIYAIFSRLKPAAFGLQTKHSTEHTAMFDTITIQQ